MTSLLGLLVYLCLDQIELICKVLINEAEGKDYEENSSAWNEWRNGSRRR